MWGEPKRTEKQKTRRKLEKTKLKKEKLNSETEGRSQRKRQLLPQSLKNKTKPTLKVAAVQHPGTLAAFRPQGRRKPKDGLREAAAEPPLPQSLQILSTARAASSPASSPSPPRPVRTRAQRREGEQREGPMWPRDSPPRCQEAKREDPRSLLAGNNDLPFVEGKPFESGRS